MCGVTQVFRIRRAAAEVPCRFAVAAVGAGVGDRKGHYMYSETRSLTLIQLAWTAMDVTVGFGDGVYDALGIDSEPNTCSDTYKWANIVGQIQGSVALGGTSASKSFRPGGWANSNRYLRIGWGRHQES